MCERRIQIGPGRTALAANKEQKMLQTLSSPRIIDETGSDASAPAVGSRKVDVGRGTVDSRLSNQWARRPDDQRFTTIDSLIGSLRARTAGTREDVVGVNGLRFDGAMDSQRLSLKLETGDHDTMTPTHYAFGQLCSLLGAPARYLRPKSGFMAALNLADDLKQQSVNRKFFWSPEQGELRAVTGEDYGRIYDLEVAEAVRRIVGNGVDDTCWKVPGVMDWGSMSYNPYVDVSKDTTTLFASDRDVYMCFVDDTHPIEVGKLADGSPDLIFRGFIVQNSEVGSAALKVVTMWLRGVCCNRNLWGVEGLEQLTIRHSKLAKDRFVHQMEPQLQRYANSSAQSLIAGITAAKQALVDEDKQTELLTKKLGFSANMAELIRSTSEREEGHPVTNTWDLINGITAVARTRPWQDERFAMEQQAGKLMDAVTKNRSL
jgi:hypothetical protein